MDHKCEQIEILMEITKTFKDPLTRQANEAVRIKNRSQKETLNSKSPSNSKNFSRRKENQLQKPKICYSGWGWTSWKTNGNGTEDILLF